MPAQCCKTCRWARFERTPTGRIVRRYAGRCAYPLPPPPVLPSSVIEYHAPYKGGIRPESGATCPVYEPAVEPREKP